MQPRDQNNFENSRYGVKSNGFRFNALNSIDSLELGSDLGKDKRTIACEKKWERTAKG